MIEPYSDYVRARFDEAAAEALQARKRAFEAARDGCERVAAVYRQIARSEAGIARGWYELMQREVRA